MKISRGEFLRLGLAGGVTLAFGGTACSGEVSTGTLLPSKAKLPEPFEVPPPVPPVLEPVRTGAGADYYEMSQKAGRVEILPGLQTEVWGYDGIFPGPTLESRSGRKIIVRQHNELPVPVSTHLHGGRTPPESDGYPTDLIPPKKIDHHHSTKGHASMAMGGSLHSRDYVYPLEQRAATLWYHDHRMDFTGPQIWRGLSGFHIVHDDVEDALPLPKDEKDVPLMLCDRSFGEGGSFMYPSLDPSLQGKPGVATPSWSTALPGQYWRFPTPATASGSSMPPTPAATGSRSILGRPRVSLLCRWAATGGYLGLPSPTTRSPSPRQSASTW